MHPSLPNPISTSYVDLSGYDQLDDMAVWIANPHLTRRRILDHFEVMRSQVRKGLVIGCDRERRVASEGVERGGALPTFAPDGVSMR